jgi:hypothetical protein
MLDVFVFAMVTLQSAPPDPAATAPAVSLGQRLMGQTGLNSSNPLTSGDSNGFGDLTITVGCTYGAPRLGGSLFADATGLTRTLTQPECTNDISSPEFGAAFVPAYLAWHRTLISAPAAGPVFLETAAATTRPIRGVSENSYGATNSYVLRHLILPKEFTAPVSPPSEIHAPAPVRAVRTTRRIQAAAH